jgi:hypothetical protein
MQRRVPMRQAAKQRWLKRSRRSERRLPVWLACLAHCIENFLFDWGINGPRQRSHWHVPPAGTSLLHEEVEVDALHDCKYWKTADTQELKWPHLVQRRKQVAANSTCRLNSPRICGSSPRRPSRRRERTMSRLRSRRTNW